MKKILLITPYFYPHIGGSQQYAKELYYHLMQKNKDIKVDVLCYNTDNVLEKEEYNGFTIYRIPCIQVLPQQFSLPNYFELIKILKKLKTNNYVFINAHTRFFESSWWAPVAAKYLKTKAILTDHCANSPTHPFFLISWFAKFTDKLLIPFVAKHYSLITVTNKSTYDFATSLGIKDSKIIYGGVDTKYFKPQIYKKHRIIPKINKVFTKQDIIITFVGRMIYSKGPHILLEASYEILKHYKNTYFIFAGEGPLYNKLKYNKNKHVFFLGSLEKNNIAKLMAQSDIIIHPSLHHEGFPNVLLEAGASGCAVIATNQGSTKEIIINNKTGILINPNKEDLVHALSDLIKNEEKRKQLKTKIREHVKRNFDWRAIVDQFRLAIDPFT